MTGNRQSLQDQQWIGILERSHLVHASVPSLLTQNSDIVLDLVESSFQNPAGIKTQLVFKGVFAYELPLSNLTWSIGPVAEVSAESLVNDRTWDIVRDVGHSHNESPDQFSDRSKIGDYLKRKAIHGFTLGGSSAGSHSLRGWIMCSEISITRPAN